MAINVVEDPKGYPERLKLQDLVGNEMAKRAIEVALSGNHSVVFIEMIDSQADKLLEATENLADTLGVDFTGSIVSLCKCKAYGSPKHECICSMALIKKHLESIAKTIKGADIIVETTAPMDYETTNRNELEEDVIKRIDSVNNFKTNPIAKDSEQFLDYAIEIGHINDKDKVIRIANTICNMEKANEIQVNHIAEAIQNQHSSINSAIADYV